MSLWSRWLLVSKQRILPEFIQDNYSQAFQHEDVSIKMKYLGT